MSKVRGEPFPREAAQNMTFKDVARNVEVRQFKHLAWLWKAYVQPHAAERLLGVQQHTIMSWPAPVWMTLAMYQRSSGAVSGLVAGTRSALQRKLRYGDMACPACFWAGQLSVLLAANGALTGAQMYHTKLVQLFEDGAENPNSEAHAQLVDLLALKVQPC